MVKLLQLPNVEADVKHREGFAKEYFLLALKALRGGSHGYKVLARNGKTITLDGEPPKKRVVINRAHGRRICHVFHRFDLDQCIEAMRLI